MTSIKLGNKVRDKVTGFEGIVTAKVEYLNGCIHFCVKPTVDKDGKPRDSEYIDWQQLEVVGEGVLIEAAGTGGPSSDTPSDRW